MVKKELYRCLNIVEIYSPDTNRSIFTILPTYSKSDDITLTIDLHRISQESSDYINFLTGFKYYSINSKFLSSKFINRNLLEINIIKSFYNANMTLDENFKRVHPIFLNFMSHVVLNYELNDLVKICIYESNDDICIDTIYGIITKIYHNNLFHKIMYNVYCNGKEISVSSNDDIVFRDVLITKKNERCQILPCENKKYLKRYDLCFSKWELDQS